MLEWEYNGEEITESGLIPDGTEVKCIIRKTELVERDYGGRLAISAVVVEGQHEGSWINDGFNVKHDNPKAQKASAANLKSLVQALDAPGRWADPSVLEAKPFMAVVIIQPASGQWEARNRFKNKSFKPVGDSSGFESSAPADKEAWTSTADVKEEPASSDGAAPWEM